jgi:hypothetical protein
MKISFSILITFSLLLSFMMYSCSTQPGSTNTVTKTIVISNTITTIITNNIYNGPTNGEIITYTNAFPWELENATFFTITNNIEYSNLTVSNWLLPFEAGIITNLFTNTNILIFTSTNQDFFTNHISITNLISVVTNFLPEMPVTNISVNGISNLEVINYTNYPAWSAISASSFNTVNGVIVSNYVSTNWLVSLYAITLTNIYTNNIFIFQSSNSVYSVSPCTTTNLSSVISNICAPVTFGLAPGSYTNSTMLISLSCATPGSTIYYTTNGRDYIVYLGSVAFVDSVALTATSLKSGYLNSPAVSGNYNLYKWRNVGIPGFSAGTATYTSIAFGPDGLPCAAYMDGGNANKATVMKFNGTNWVNVGSAGFSTGLAADINIAFGIDGCPYVGYQDVGNGTRATVMKFNGSIWQTVGSAGFSPGGSCYNKFAIAPDGTPYIAFNDVIYNKTSVMKFNGTSWVYVGSAGFSGGSACWQCIAFGSDGTPYVAMQDPQTGGDRVMKFNGTSWVYVGNLLSGGSSYPSIAIGPDGYPNVPYQDNMAAGKATVMKFNGSSWANIGNYGFSVGAIANTSIAFGPDGLPYVAFGDAGLTGNGKASVMVLNGSSWVNVGPAGFSSGTVSWPCLVFSPDGIPFVIYGDGGNSGKATVMKFSK